MNNDFTIITEAKWPLLDVQLSSTYDFWYFITLWTTIFTLVIFEFVGIFAFFFIRKQKKSSAFFLPITFTVFGGLSGLINGSLLSLALSVIYASGNYTMNGWIALIWGLLLTLISIITSYSTITTFL
jgi:hypothetical protein